MAITKTFPTEYLLEELKVLHNNISDEIIDQRRWVTVHEITFQIPGQPEGEAWRTTYDVGSTEMQDQSPWEFEKEVTCTLVRQVEKVMKVWEPIEESAYVK